MQQTDRKNYHITKLGSNLPKLIIFDWDNTLVDTWPLLHQATVEMMTGMGKDPWTLDHTKKSIHRSMRDALPDMFGENWPQAAEIYQAAYKRLKNGNLRLLPQAMDILDFLKNNTNIPLMIISNKLGSNLREEVKLLNLEQYFTKVIGSQDTKFDKPSHLVVEHALSDTNIIASHEVWFVGDTIIDVECAINSGCLPILYGEAAHIAPDQLPDLYFENHTQFLTALKTIYPQY
jgi:phosphoglycolate phosphatase